MKKLIALVRKFRARLTINMSKHPILMAVALLIAANLIVILIASGVIVLVAPDEYSNYLYAVARACEWLLIPSAVLAIKNPAVIVIGIVVAITGMVLFTGTVIAVTTNYLRSYITQKTEGRGKLPLSNHIVILNYNPQVIAVLVDLMHDGADDTVLILSDKNKEFINAELSAELASLPKRPDARLNLIVRKGDPLSNAELEEINICEARGILVMSDEAKTAVEQDISTSDFDAFKAILNLAKFDIPKSCPIAVEAESYETAQMIKDLKKSIAGLKSKSIEVFSYNRKLGQFLALSILHPPMTKLLYNLLSFSGCMFYPVDAMPVGEYLQQYSGSVPVITLDKTFVLTADIKHLRQKRDKPLKTNRLVPLLETLPQEDEINLFIIGENKKSGYMLETLKSESRQININSFKVNQRTEFVDALKNAGEGNNVAVILSEENVCEKNKDENVLLTLIEIHRNFGSEKRPFKIIAEILDSKNQTILEQFNIQNIIVSSRIISFFATKLITDISSDRFYEDLFTHSLNSSKSNFSLCIRDAKELFDFSQNLTFHSYAELVSAVYNGSGHAIMPLGVLRKNTTIYFCTEMDKKRSFTLKKDDHFIYASYKSDKI